MSEPAGHYSDPLEDALSQGTQRVAQLASLLGAAAEVALRRKTLKDARETAGTSSRAGRVIGEQEDDAHQQARLRWAPALDRAWLARADLLQTARAWSAAACYADTDPLAASAMRKCEERLRTLHPYAMARYDRLRSETINPLDAMTQAAPLFGRPPHARPGDPGMRRAALGTASEEGAPMPAGDPLDMPSDPDRDAGLSRQTELRGRRIAESLQDHARAAGLDQLRPEELAIVLESVTNLPEEVIEQIARTRINDSRAQPPGYGAQQTELVQDGGLDQVAAVARAAAGREQKPLTAGATGTGDHARPGNTADRTAAQMAAESFPHSVTNVIAVIAAEIGKSARPAARTTMQQQKRRPPAQM